MLAAKGLCGGYVRGASVLDHVDVQVAPGELVAMLGANGAGKTTTLGAILGIVPFAHGEVTVDGRATTGWSAADFLAQGVALVPEGRGILVGLSVHENLRMGGYIVRNRKELERRIAGVFEIFPALEARLRQKAGVLSGGEQQMLAVARALISRPRYLLLDEPSMGLAPNIVQSLMDVIRALADDGVGVLLVEQNARAALRVADTGYALEAGRIVVSGDSAELRDNDVVRASYLGTGVS